MGETSSIVSRSPPPSVSTSHSNERRWISIRLGSSRGFSRRAKLRRWRGASTGAKTAAPSGSSEGEARAHGATRQDSTARHTPISGCSRPSRTPLRGAAIYGGALPKGAATTIGLGRSVPLIRDPPNHAPRRQNEMPGGAFRRQRPQREAVARPGQIVRGSGAAVGGAGDRHEAERLGVLDPLLARDEQ